MNFAQLSKLFERGVRTIKSSGKKGRKIARGLYAYRRESFDTEGGPRKEWFEIECYRDRILSFYPDGSLLLDNHGRWNSRVLRDRFHQVLPEGGRISSWRLSCFVAPLQRVAFSRAVWTLRIPGYGTFPWKNNADYNQFGRPTSLCADLLERNASTLVGEVQEFAKVTVKALLRGDLWSAETCYDCLYAFSQLDTRDAFTRNNPPPQHLMQRHLLKHIESGIPSLPLLLRVCDSRNKDAAMAVRGMTREFRDMWTYARTNRAKARQMELSMLHPEMKNIPAHPTQYARLLRWRLTEDMLEALGFEVMG